MSKSLPAVGRDDKGLVRFASRQDRPDTLSTIPRHWLKPQLAMVTSLDFAADTLAGAGGQVCCVWSMETDVLLRRIVAPAPIRCIALSRDAKYLAIGAGAIVSVYRLDNGNLSFEYPHPEIVCSVHFAAAAPLLASASTDGSVQVHHLRNGTMAMRAMHRIGGSVVFLENHGRFVVSESSVDMQFIDTGSGQVTRTFSHHDEPIAPGPLGCMGKMLIAYSGEAVHLFDTARSENACFRVIEYRSTVTSVDISPNQSLFLVTTVDGSVNFYNMGDGTWVAQLESFTNPLWGAKFCGNNTIFAAGGEALIMKIHDGRHVQSYCEAPPIVAGALSPERNTLLVSDRVGGVTCYNLTSGKRSNPFTPHSGSVSVVTGNGHKIVEHDTWRSVKSAERLDMAADEVGHRRAEVKAQEQMARVT